MTKGHSKVSFYIKVCYAIYNSLWYGRLDIILASTMHSMAFWHERRNSQDPLTQIWEPTLLSITVKLVYYGLSKKELAFCYTFGLH